MGKDLFNSHFHKFSIRKLNVGVCSVLLSTLVLLGITSQVSADETSSSRSQNDISRKDIYESPVLSVESTIYEQGQNTERTVSATDIEKSQSADNSIQRNSEIEGVKESKDSIKAKSGDFFSINCCSARVD